MKSYCIDASAMVIYVTGEKVTEDIGRIMSEIEDGTGGGIISSVNVAEFHRAITRISSVDKADKLVAWMQESNLKIAPPSLEIAILASVKKQKYASRKTPFAWGDAFCLATAIEHNVDFIITSDDEFDHVSEIPLIKI